MTGRHRKPPKFTAIRHYALWTAAWAALVAAGFFLFNLIKDIL